MFLPYSLRPAAWRGYLATTTIAANTSLTDTVPYLLGCVLGVFRVLVLVSLWRMILPADGTTSGMTVEAVLTYTLLASVFAQQLDVRTDLTWNIWTGLVAVRHVQPIAIPAIYVAEATGYWLFYMATFGLPLFLAAPLFGVDPRPASPLLGFVFVPSLALAVAVGLALDFLVGAVLIITHENIWSIQSVRSAVGILLSGALLPLQLYPWGLGEVFAWLPFAAMGSAPLRIYTGTGDPGLLLLSQLAWALLLWPAVQWIWRANRDAIAATGG